MAARSPVIMTNPIIGQGATKYVGSDRYAYEVVEVLNDRSILVREMRVIRMDQNGWSSEQTYRFESDPDADVEHFTLRKGGYWIKKGVTVRYGSRLILGIQDHYMDPCF